MLNSIIDFSLRHRALVIMGVLVFAALDGLVFQELPSPTQTALTARLRPCATCSN